LFYLPRYAPERNPVEYLNDDVKRQVSAEGLPENEERLPFHLQWFMFWPL